MRNYKSASLGQLNLPLLLADIDHARRLGDCHGGASNDSASEEWTSSTSGESVAVTSAEAFDSGTVGTTTSGANVVLSDKSDASMVDSGAVASDAWDGAELDSGANGDPAPVVPGNLIANPGFEQPVSGWYSFGSAFVASSTERAHAGVRSSFSSGRTTTFDGPAIQLRNVLEPGKTYHISAWVISGTYENDIGVSLKTICNSADAGLVEAYHPITSAFSGAEEWVQLDGEVELPSFELTSVEIYFDGPPKDVDFYLDDVSVVAL